LGQTLGGVRQKKLFFLGLHVARCQFFVLGESRFGLGSFGRPNRQAVGQIDSRCRSVRAQRLPFPRWQKPAVFARRRRLQEPTEAEAGEEDSGHKEDAKEDKGEKEYHGGQIGCLAGEGRPAALCAALFWALFCGLTFLAFCSDLFQNETGLVKGLDSQAVTAAVSCAMWRSHLRLVSCVLLNAFLHYFYVQQP
jgi:hypothetical protein